MAEKKALEKKKTVSERFAALVMLNFNSLIGRDGMKFNDKQKKLAQHLFLKIDQSLKKAEIDRIKSGLNKLAPRIWENVNMQKLAIDAVHRINLGLDALIPNHISPIPYWNSKEKAYDLDLRIGYVGQDYYRRKMAIEKPVDIIYELVYETDEFQPMKKSIKNDIESYEFEIKQPFNRGKIIGGFGYIMYEDSRKNKLIIVSEDDFKKAEECAASKEFWTKWPINQRYKTLVHRVTGKLSIDPDKVNESFAAVEDEEERVLQQIEDNANKETVDIGQESKTLSFPTEESPQDSQIKDEQFQEPSSEKEALSQSDQPEGPGF